MRRNRLCRGLMLLTLATVMLWPATGLAQWQRPAYRPIVRRPLVVYRGHYGYPFYSAYWGSYPWSPYSAFAYPQRYFWPLYYDTSAIRLQVTPRHAEVYLDGYFVGTVDDFDGTFERLRARPGEHELVLYLEGYRSIRQQIRLQPGKDLRIRDTMTPLSPGEPNEPRPAPAARPPREEAPPEYAPPPRRVPPVPPRAAPGEARGFGTLAIRVQPPDAEVLIDGERWRGPDAQDRLLVQVAEGMHRVEVRKAGYLSYSTEIQVRRGETSTLNVSLPPRDPAPATPDDFGRSRVMGRS